MQAQGGLKIGRNSYLVDHLTGGASRKVSAILVADPDSGWRHLGTAVLRVERHGHAWAFRCRKVVASLREGDAAVRT